MPSEQSLAGHEQSRSILLAYPPMPLESCGFLYFHPVLEDEPIEEETR
jgi:hypothetical protein